MNSAGYLQQIRLENWNIIVDLGPMLLGNTLRNPYNVTAFLFLQLQIRIENTEMELLNESKHVQFDLSMGNR